MLASRGKRAVRKDFKLPYKKSPEVSRYRDSSGPCFETTQDFKWSLTILEIEVPPAIIPFQGNFSPTQGNLRVGIKGPNVGPG